jgi:uncharacterized membrane protein YedE/YeeE
MVMSVLQIFTVLVPLAFIVGFALQRGNVCSVLAARQIAWTGRWSRMRGLLLASAWAFAAVLPLVWLGIGPFKLSGEFAPSLVPALGGLLYGIGCYVNGACIFGVCSRLTAGNLSFLFAVPGMAFGATMAEFAQIAPPPDQLTPAVAAVPHPWLIGIWAAIVLLLALSAWRMVRAHWRAGITLANILRQSRWRSTLAATFLGVIGGILYATDVAWIYPALVKRMGFYVAGLHPAFPLATVAGSVALFLGGIAAALLRGRFVIRAPLLRRSVQALIGGAIMGFAWALVPGGNDAMVLYLLPSLAIHGIIAYAALLATLIGLEILKRKGYIPG